MQGLLAARLLCVRSFRQEPIRLGDILRGFNGHLGERPLMLTRATIKPTHGYAPRKQVLDLIALHLPTPGTGDLWDHGDRKKYSSYGARARQGEALFVRPAERTTRDDDVLIVRKPSARWRAVYQQAIHAGTTRNGSGSRCHHGQG